MAIINMLKGIKIEYNAGKGTFNREIKTKIQINTSVI